MYKCIYILKALDSHSLSKTLTATLAVAGDAEGRRSSPALLLSAEELFAF